MTVIRDYLADDLAEKVQRRGVVIWDDPECSYADIAAEVAPSGSAFYLFDGSWFALRKAVEGLLAGTEPPSVLVYVAGTSPEPDPLEELRAFGSRYRITLATLLKNALTGQLSEQRIIQIGKQCATAGEAEAALEGADSTVDARLIAIVGDASTRVIAARLLSGAHGTELDGRGLGDVVRATLAESLGGDFTGLDGDDLRAAAFRQVVLAVLDSVIGDLPEALRTSFSPSNAGQLKTCWTVLEALQTDKNLWSEYVALASLTDEQLQLGSRLAWDDALVPVSATPAIEAIALAEGLRRLQAGDFSGARNLGVQRLASSWWVRSESPDGDSSASQWRAVNSLGALGEATARPVPTLSSLEELLNWYTAEGWETDSSFRQSEYVRVTAGAALDEFDDLYHRARVDYEAWLDTVLRAASVALVDVDVPAADLQRSIHDRYVRNGPRRCAYVLVDALRYELGRDLANRLTSVNAEVTMTAAVGTPPTITPVGMAALLPGAVTSFDVDLAENDHLAVSVGGDRIRNVADRVKRLEHAHGNVVDLDLDRLAQFSNKELKKKIGDSNLVLVRSTEIDADGESDLLAASWGSFDTTLNVLHTAVAKLLHAGIDRVVITADHGFLAVRQLGEDRRIDKPLTGAGEQHRRAWIGRGGTATESTVKVPLAAFGIGGDLDIITPLGLGVFFSGGGLQFFHGGLSPQELVVPVITVLAADASPEPKYEIFLEVAGGRITTGVVAVTVGMTGDLFTRESRIRLQVVQDRGRVAVVVGGDGYDDATETIDASVDKARVITMQVTASILSGSTATLEVLDAATGVRLSALDVDVAADVIVEEDLE